MFLSRFPKYKLSEKQIKGLANIIAHEQGTVAGMYAEASLMCNLTDIKGDSYATVNALIAKATGGWFAYGKSRYNAGTSNKTAIKVVRDVMVKGKRTLPRYVNEHDCLSDIKSVTNGSKGSKKAWKAHSTVIKNVYGSKWTFYGFPGGYSDDPFGYTSSAYREKWGESCYTVEQAKNDNISDGVQYKGKFPELPKRGYFKLGDNSEQVKLLEEFLKWAGFHADKSDGVYGAHTKLAVDKFEKACGLTVDGKFGKNCLKQAKEFYK